MIDVWPSVTTSTDVVILIGGRDENMEDIVDHSLRTGMNAIAGAVVGPIVGAVAASILGVSMIMSISHVALVRAAY